MGAAGETCSAASVAAGEPLPGTATEARRWLLVEWGGAWARDVSETALPDEAGAAAAAFDGRTLLLRRPGRDARGRAFELLVAESDETGGALYRPASFGALDAGDPVEGPVVLVCCHGRRDPCCARLGPPVYDALGTHLAPERLWQCSHLGGHRFAANVLVLPDGILLGRVLPGDAGRVAGEIVAGRIPLAHYRGRTIHPPAVQAADAAVRRELGLVSVADLRLVDQGGARVRFDTARGTVDVEVEEREGPIVPASCGAAPEPSRSYVARLL